MNIIWTIVIGFVAGIIAKLITPGRNEPSGFILTTILGIIGAFVATWLGQALGWYGPDEGAGLIGAVIGAIIVLLIWGAVSRQTQVGTKCLLSFGSARPRYEGHSAWTSETGAAGGRRCRSRHASWRGSGRH